MPKEDIQYFETQAVNNDDDHIMFDKYFVSNAPRVGFDNAKTSPGVTVILLSMIFLLW